MKVGDVTFIEDYQMNLTVEYEFENPTALAYSSNKNSVAIYPMAAFSICPESGKLVKNAIVFVTEDRLHDHNQVVQFEIEAVNILRSKGIQVTNILRFTDTCSNQYRSKNCNSDLRMLPSLLGIEGIITWGYFEAGEGKNLSDTIGALVKMSFVRGMKKEDRGIQSVTDVVEIMRKNIQEETKQFKNLVIVEIGP